MDRAWSAVVTVDRFTRLHLLFFTAMWLLLGVASGVRATSAAQLAALVGIVVCFHVYAYVLNDVIDLPIDRTHAGRQHDPLVRGVIRPSQALWLALVQPLLTVPLTWWLGGGWPAQAMLLAGFALMGAYNLWGKRCPFPPLTDAVQGLAWGSLAIYGASVMGATPNALTWMVVAYATVFTMFINGIHGSLRDLSNDLATGARTTALYLGARPAAAERAGQIPAALAVYAWAILAALIGLNGTVMLRNDFGYGQRVWIVTTGLVAVLNVWAALLQPGVLRPRGPASDVAWRLQMYLLVLCPPIAFAAHTRLELLAVFILLNVIALVLWNCTADVTRSAWLMIRSAIPYDGRAGLGRE